MSTIPERVSAAGWHLDRRVPVALIATLVMQTIGVVWWAATISARVDAIERRLFEMHGYAARLARLEERQLAVAGRLDRIEALQRRIDGKLDRLLMNRNYGGRRR
ncbi:MAG TPA: hypothetical protein ENK13_03115 [Thermopetrobacter sp.]|nr:hypothetical protein [Thermopetrobacter sp.]